MADEKKTLQDEVSQPTSEQRMAALKLIRLMKGDVVTAMQTGAPLVIEGEGPLKAIMTVIEVAEHATLKEMAPILGANGKLVL